MIQKILEPSCAALELQNFAHRLVFFCMQTLQSSVPFYEEKKRKIYAVRRHNGSPQTWEQPGLAAQPFL